MLTTHNEPILATGEAKALLINKDRALIQLNGHPISDAMDTTWNSNQIMENG